MKDEQDFYGRCLCAGTRFGAARAGAAEGETLEEVTVLADRAGAATKTDTLIVEIPQSISVVTAEQIMERGATSYQEVFRYSAGVATELSGGDTRSDYFAARGFALKQYLDGLNKTPKGLYGSTHGNHSPSSERKCCAVRRPCCTAPVARVVC